MTTLATEDCHGDSTADDDACYREVAGKVANRPAEIVARGFIDVQNRNSLTIAPARRQLRPRHTADPAARLHLPGGTPTLPGDRGDRPHMDRR